MNFDPSTEQAALRESVRRWVERDHGFEKRMQRLRDSAPPRAPWSAMAELGWLGAGLPENAGGYGGGPIETAIVLEELARGLVLEPYLPVAVAARVLALDSSGVSSTLEALVAGERIVVPALDADMTVDGDRLSGRARFVLGGAEAEAAVVVAGKAVALLPLDRSGVERIVYRAVDGRRVADLIFDGVSLETDDLVGVDAENARALARDDLLVGLCAEAVGAMDAALWTTRDYLKTRRQFGVELASFQALQHRAADMLVEVELSRSMLYRALAALGSDDQAHRAHEVAAAKAYVGEAGWSVGGWAVQLHGGIGVSEEAYVGHLFKRLAFIRTYAGAADGHLARMAEAYRA